MGLVLGISLLAGLATLLGGLGSMGARRWAGESLALFFGLAAGIMGAVVVMDLLPAALAYANLFLVLGGFTWGLALMYGFDSLLRAGRLSYHAVLPALSPYLHRHRGSLAGSNPGFQAYFTNMGFSVALGIAMHDLPEGLAIAAGYSVSNSLGLNIALAVTLHNIPEGLALAVPLRLGGMPFWGVLGVTALVSLFTPLGTLVGLVLAGISPAVIAILLSGAAGSMVYIISCELLPEGLAIFKANSLLGVALGVLLMAVVFILEGF